MGKGYEVEKVMVIGAGTMGTGIAQVLIEANLKVFVYDSNAVAGKRCQENIQRRLQKKVEKKERSKEEIEKILSCLEITESLEKCRDSDFVIEAIVEDMEAKKNLFSRLDEICSGRVILASNTSALSITEIASATRNPEKVIGLHFFNPAPVMKLVEVIKGEKTAEETLSITRSLVEKMGKTAVLAKESPGFIVNRLLMPMINEAIFLVSEGVASIKDIDTAMKLGASHPLGPLELADFIGLDVCLRILETLEKGLKDNKYRPCPMLKTMVKEGKLGRKTGQGFYNYQEKER